jgi:tetratricopeptide (TPR) repeat protein
MAYSARYTGIMRALPIVHRPPIRIHWLLRAVACAFSVTVCVAVARAQPAPDGTKTISALRDRIRAAKESRAPDAELGRLWLLLGSRYEGLMSLPEAEDAYARALRLLHGNETERPAYADALAGMGSLYLDTGRLPEAKASLTQSAEIYSSLGDSPHAAKPHETLAIALASEKKFREAEAESLLARTMMESSRNPDPNELLVTRLTHAYALCFQRQCGPASQEVDEAMATALRKLPPDSLGMMVAWIARAFVDEKLGANWEPAISEALRIARARTEQPEALRRHAELSVLREYDQLLKDSHRKAEAKTIELQMARLQEQHPSVCTACVVSAAALASPGLRH